MAHLAQQAAQAVNSAIDTVKHKSAKAAVNGVTKSTDDILSRPHPQSTYDETVVDPNSFWGKLRMLYSSTVLKTQLKQLKKQGSYRAFDLQFQDVYNVRRLHGAMTRLDGIPPSLFWESDCGKWIEAVCYYLSSPDTANSAEAPIYRQAMDHLVDEIAKSQGPDGYIGIYFRVVDPEGRFKNLRDMHEMYNSGHLLEAALAHYKLTGSRVFLDVMIKNMDCFMKVFGPGPDQLHGYPGHPELELAVLRLYSITRDPRHLEFGRYLLEARGVKREDQKNLTFFEYEAEELRKDELHFSTLLSLNDMTYNQSHLPIVEQDEILGHSVRAFYLTTAAADLGGEYLEAAKRLWTDATARKMYSTGGFGSQPRTEGFHPFPYHLPQSTDEGGCYAETCAAIAAVMTSERILSHGLDGHVRDVMELCMVNAVIAGGSLDGTAFSYANKHATYGDESAIRNEWFEVCCCPPNLSRTLGMIGGYASTAKIDEAANKLSISIYLFISGTRKIALPNGEVATLEMTSEMPWQGRATFTVSAPRDWTWELNLPEPEYARDIKISAETRRHSNGYLSVQGSDSATIIMSFDMPVRLLSPHPATGQQTLVVSRGPITFVAEDVDNEALETAHPHFKYVGISKTATFTESQTTMQGFSVPTLTTNDVFVREEGAGGLYRPKESDGGFKKAGQSLTYIPWFAKANRGGRGHLRVAMLAV